MRKTRKLKVGKDSVVIGNVEGEVGDRSVYIGATDERGNVRIDPGEGGFAAGYGARAGRGSVAIGAGAGAGVPPEVLFIEAMDKLSDAVTQTKDDELMDKFDELVTEIEKKQPDKNRILKTIDYLKAVPALKVMSDTVQQAYDNLEPYLQHLDSLIG